MNKTGKIILKILKIFLLIIAICIISFFIIRWIGQAYNRKTPDGGINESMFIDINGTQQWISIYGENKNNPVLLYLHGGPGSSTSGIDYAFTRKWADIYTVVTWDQRNCGKSYSKNQNNIKLTYDLMMSDGIALTEFLLDYFNIDKISLLGHSWGTFFGSNLALAYPQYYDCYIGTGQLVDFYETEVAFKAVATEWVGNDIEMQKTLALVTPEHFTPEHFTATSILMNKYGYGMMVDGTDYNFLATVIFNPYYTLKDWLNYLKIDFTVYLDFLLSDEFNKFSLIGKNDYQVPYININGDRDYQTNYLIAQDYFDKINAPYKKMYIIKDTTHGLLESKSQEFSDILHEITKSLR